jgi:L-ribulose-5-phosphate 3-epimerase
MQGRLSPVRNGRIQSFPWETWEDEFEAASRILMGKMEWTIDSEDFYSNPLLTSSGRERIRLLISRYNLKIPSVTCDYFMENPPWKTEPDSLFENVESILKGMSEVGAKILVIPLVDNSSLIDSSAYSHVLRFFRRVSNSPFISGLIIAFETDLCPEDLANFMSNFPKESFGVNYDIGNSASFGFDPIEEFKAVGTRVINVHVKDRLFGGTTVPLGTGNADFPKVLRCLTEYGYVGNLIMQTARAQDGNHAGVLVEYRNQILDWMDETK